MSKKLSKFWFYFLIGSISVSSLLLPTFINEIKTFDATISKKQLQQDSAEVINFNASTRLPTIISNVGPVLMDANNTIFQLDWFGKRVWSTNVKQQLIDKGHIAPTGTNAAILGFPQGAAVIGWTYSSITSKIYLHIPATIKGNDQGDNNWKYQYIVPLDPVTGRLELEAPEKTPRINVSSSTWNGRGGSLGFQYGIISQLGDGSIVIYGLLDLSGISNGGAGYLVFSPGTNTLRQGGQIFGISPTDYYHRIEGLNFFNVLPINTVPISRTNSLFITHNARTNNIYVHLTDNNFGVANKLWKDSPLLWNPPAANTGFRPIPKNNPLNINNNYGITNNYYYNTVNNETWLPYLDKIFFIRPNGSALGYEASSIELPKLRSGIVPWDSGVIYSSYLDLRGDLFFNMATWDGNKNDWTIGSTIYKLSATTKRYTPYVDLATSDNPDISRNTSGFKIFAVPVQVGKIMLINKETGIAVAVDEDPAAPGSGRIIGTLNGAHSFLRSPDFSLNLGAQFLLPSQLQPQNFRASGTGSIINYEVVNADDTKGTIEVKATINYVPWFETATSTNVTSTQVTRTFTGLKTTQALKFDVLDYQLSNTRVDFIDDEALKKRNLFNLANNDIDSSLQTKLSYSVQNVNRDTGEFQVKASLANYTPVIDANGPEQSFEVSQTYQALAATTVTSEYQIGLVSGSSITGGHLNQVASVALTNLPPVLQFLLSGSRPSSLIQQKDHLLDLLIDHNKFKAYPLFKLDIDFTTNPQNNQLTAKIIIPAAINQQLGLGEQQQIIQTTYTGFSTTGAREKPFVNFETFNNPIIDGDVVQLNLNDLKNSSERRSLLNLLPSDIRINHLWNYFFKHNDFNVEENLGMTLLPDNVQGTLDVVLTKRNHSALALFQNYEVIHVKIEGFRQATPQNYQQHGISFVNPNSETLLQLQRQKNASEVTYQDVNRLVIFGTDLLKQSPNFSLTNQNTKLFANNNLGELSVVITLPFTNRLQTPTNQISLPNIYQYTFRNFSRTQANTSLFQTLSQEQLTTQLDLTQLTPEQIFANSSSFVLRSEGYKLTSANQISVQYSKTLDVVYITYDFSGQRDLEPDVPLYYTAVYKLN
ncbi:hypothetical protein J2Z62_000017 [Mycoplasmoides fastidiosum]|uniref:Lipoprotein-associated type-17 domain-containing protein n=1 Tax=Mycoplasmoides fastidiosum TaxID=92758 RepID=A0ABU0LY05_9BACT|nr:lipoprotein 17-related variable surface protein [Mycoplasmoides fastidiosum]MDQ0513579.1 hypothetical protein [Mycoplasmoides fastidiosum]UUD37999.1 lipoprotein 17-related variable surface protein [Mycoplasmoides fastidiosum]